MIQYNVRKSLSARGLGQDSCDRLRNCDEWRGPEITSLVRYHFAYRVENSHFWNSQSGFYRDLRPDAVHYRFVTGNACLDVITTDVPSFDFVPFAYALRTSA